METKERHFRLLTVARFDAADGAPWQRFVQWSGLQHLEEVVSLDPHLCPPTDGAAAAQCPPDPWPTAAPAGPRLQLLAALEEPEAASLAGVDHERFEFLGFDLIEPQAGLSVLTNCGGFPQAFTTRDLSRAGLIPDFEGAQAVRRRLGAAYPNDPHARCRLWALWRVRP
jgi:hypothetical protein